VLSKRCILISATAAAAAAAAAATTTTTTTTTTNNNNNNNNNNKVGTDKTIPNNKTNIIINDNTKGTCMLIDVAISGDRNVIKKETEKILKYKDLIIEIQCMWNMKE
jgi:hypothetical protein